MMSALQQDRTLNPNLHVVRFELVCLVGSYGWDHAAYWGIAEMKAGVDLKEWYKTRTDAEFYLPEFKTLIDDPQTQQSWARIATFDPMGMYAHPPTIAACKAHLDMEELKDLRRDGNIVKDNGEIN